MSWLEVEDRGLIRWLTLNRPERKNAIPHEGWPVLTEAFLDFERSPSRVLVVQGAGGDFCAGADLDLSKRGESTAVSQRHERMKVVGRAALALHRLTKPTIAAVDGVAVGAGMNLALGCDVVVAGEAARFSEIFVRRGLTLDFGGTWLLPRVVGLLRAKELALSGRFVDAEEALKLGLVIDVVPSAGLEAKASEIAESFLEGAPIAQMFAKQALNASYGSSFSDAIGWEGQSQAIALGSEDFVEGVTAFFEKTDPEWKGR